VSLLAEAKKERPERRVGPISWWDKLQDKDPFMADQVEQLVDGFNQGYLPNFASMTELLEFLIRKKVVDDNVTENAFRTYCKKRRLVVRGSGD
jgi:hypothetical protein